MVGPADALAAAPPSEDPFRSLFETAPCAWLVLDSGGEIVVVNAQAERLFGYDRDELIGRSIDAVITGPDVPVPWYRAALDGPARLARTVELRDVLGSRKDDRAFPADISVTALSTDHGMLLSVAVTDMTERKLAAEALAHQARHDPLTGLPNRTLFLDRLEHALARARRSKRSLAVMFLDLDDFKFVNDMRGHEVGDQLLVALTPRLTAALRPGDTIARFGGDEFVVLCEDLSDDSDAIQIAKRIADACGGPVSIGDYEQVVTISTGVVLVTDPETASASGVLRDADAAMYRAKADGKGRIEVFDDRMRAALIERIAIESSLRRAIDRGELRVLYQPVVSIGRRRIVAMEALLRWQHPHRGLLEPSEFIHVAESTGQIVQIGEWVIEQAARQALAWRQAAPDAEPVRVSVNLSPRQVLGGDVAETVARILDETGLDPSLLEFEITETMLFEGADACVRAVRELKQLGVRLVLDDFGTGYASFGYLTRLAIDAIKLDRAFVGRVSREDDDGAIVSAVLSLARALNVEVTAEGVETSAQLSRLRGHGCEFAQGYLFSRPVAGEEAAALLELATATSGVTASPAALG